MQLSTTLRLTDTQQSLPIRQQVYRALRDAIVRMQLYPGQALSEKEIAERFGISRQPVREAFIRLAEAGLVKVQPQRGTFVVKISQKAVRDVRFVREAVEVAVVRTAALQGLNEDTLAQLYELIEAQEKVTEKADFERFYLLDEALHRALALAIGNDYAWRVVEDIKAQMDRVRYLSLPEATPLKLLTEQHAEIVEAIARRDPERAERAMHIHLSEILQSLPRLAERFPDMFQEDAAESSQSEGLSLAL